MAFGDILGPIGGGILRVVAAIFGKTPSVPEKYLQGRIMSRGIVAELPVDFLFKIVDPLGRTHRGVYLLNVLIWNKGSQGISPSDFLDNAPLRLAIDNDSYIIMADVLSNDDQLACSVSKSDEQNIDIYFDCINPGDYLNIILFYGGKPMAYVEILGRIRGQAASIDHHANEVKARISERFAYFFVLLFILNVPVGLPISSWLIYRDYGFEKFLHLQPDIPMTILMPFGMGINILIIFVLSRIGAWWERRKYPPGYPLSSDFEPPLIENIKGMILTVFTGRKQRLSTSMFDWAKPAFVRRKKSKRRSVDDWIA